MISNNIYHSQPLAEIEKLVNRSPKETTVFAKWTNIDISSMNNAEADISAAYDDGLPCVNIVPSPSDVSFKLFPVTNHIDIMNGKTGALIYLYFYPISLKSSGGAGYSAKDINDAIDNSTLTKGGAYNQTVIKNSQMVSHQPNWFRPKFLVNSNIDYFNLDETSGDYPTGNESSIFKPEFAQGLNLPYEENGQDKALKVYSSINAIDVYAGAYQKIKIGNTYVYQPYIMCCEAKFIIID